MKFTPIEPPRTFSVGKDEYIQIADCGRVELSPNEQVTFTTPSGTEYDFVRKEWGYYATPSLNGRLSSFGLRAVLVKSPGNKFYIFAVEQGKEPMFQEYIDKEKHEIISWLDSDDELKKVEDRLKG